MDKRPLAPQSEFLGCLNLPTVLVLLTRLCLGGGVRKGCCQGCGADTGVPVRPGWLPCWQGTGTGARLAARHSPRVRPHRCWTQQKGDVGRPAVPYAGMGTDGWTPGCTAETSLCFLLHRSTRVQGATQRFVVSILAFLSSTRGKKRRFTGAQTDPTEG